MTAISAMETMFLSIHNSDNYEDIERTYETLSDIFEDKTHIYRVLFETAKGCYDRGFRNVQTFIKKRNFTDVPVYVTIAFLEVYSMWVTDVMNDGSKDVNETPLNDFMMYLISITDHDSFDLDGANLFQYMLYSYNLPRIIINYIIDIYEEKGSLLNRDDRGRSSLEFIMTNKDIRVHVGNDIKADRIYNYKYYNKRCEKYDSIFHLKTYDSKGNYVQKNKRTECKNCVDHKRTYGIIKSLIAEYHLEPLDIDGLNYRIMNIYKNSLNMSYEYTIEDNIAEIDYINKNISTKKSIKKKRNLIREINKSARRMINQ